MNNGKKWMILSSALLLIVALTAMSFCLTACNREGQQATWQEAVDTGNYVRQNTAGEKIKASLTNNGVEADMSAYTSIGSVAVMNDSLYATDETGKRVLKLSLSGELQQTYTTEKQINGIVADGAFVYVLEGGLNGAVVKLTAELSLDSSCTVGHTPSDMAVIDGKGFVVNRFSDNVTVVRLSDMQVTDTVAVEGREPIAAVRAGSEIYVACHLPDEAVGDGEMHANVVVLSGETGQVVKTLALVNGASGVKDICVSPDGQTVYVSHIVGRYAYPTTQLDRGWINTNGVSIINTAQQNVQCAVLLDEVDLGAANPWGITVSGDGNYLCVALSGTDEVMLVDIPAMNRKIDAVANQTGGGEVESLADIVDYLPFLNDCRQRIPVGVGVRSLAEHNGVLYCGLYFDGNIAAINLSNGTSKTLSFATQPEANVVRQGHILWSDANNCYQKWQSCNSCHPDAVVDGFNWDNLNDGLGGGGKSAKSMLYAHRTPPVMVTGIRPDAETAVAAGMKFIQFNTLSETQLSYIDEYLKSLQPLQSPYLMSDGVLTASAADGKAIFEQSCASCHPAPLYTDLEKHNVNSNTFSGDTGDYDTPSLIEVWRTAPYMHDGSLYTIEEVARFFAPDLTDTQVAAVAEYVRSIGDMGEQYGVEQVFAVKDGVARYNLYVPGASLTQIAVRKQKADGPEMVVVALSVYDQNNTQVFYADGVVKELSYNENALVYLGEGIVLPEGGYYTVDLFDAATGECIATTLTIKG